MEKGKEGESHIEHFRRKNRAHFPQLTFDWNNLFLSCGGGDREHCGHHKDGDKAVPYKPDDLIKPDEHDPDEFLHFHSSGTVAVRSNAQLDNAKKHHAEETIRVFNLDSVYLRPRRGRVFEDFEKRDYLDDVQSWDEPLRSLFIHEEIEKAWTLPFGTVIRHFFERWR